VPLSCVGEQSVAADKHPRSPASRLPPMLAAEPRRSASKNEGSRISLPGEGSLNRTGKAWLGLSGARPLFGCAVQDWQTTAGSLERQAFHSLSFGEDRLIRSGRAWLGLSDARRLFGCAVQDWQPLPVLWNGKSPRRERHRSGLTGHSRFARGRGRSGNAPGERAGRSRSVLGRDCSGSAPGPRSRRLSAEQSVAADKHLRSPASRLPSELAAERRRWASRMRVREFENLTSREGMVDSNWQGMAGSLGCSAARRLLCSRLSTTAGSLERQASER